MTRKLSIIPLLVVAAGTFACARGGVAGDAAATETAIAALGITKIAPTSGPVPMTAEVATSRAASAASGEITLPTPLGPGQPGGTPGPGRPQQPGGPFNDQTYYATSTDGLNWSAGRLLAEHASVPEVVRTSAGVIWAYWVDFTTATGPGTEKIGVARSSDGVTWEKLGTVNFSEIGSLVPVDPDVMQLPEGRLRMYFFDIAGRQGQNTIYSAVSSDGLNYTLESGARFTLANIYDPNVVVLPDGQYRMYLNMQNIISATSSDGLTFTTDDGVRVERGAVPGAIVLPDGSVRLYACVDGVSVYTSTDGLNFSLEKKAAIGVPSTGGIICDPSVTAVPNGYLMVYKYSPGQGRPGGGTPSP